MAVDSDGATFLAAAIAEADSAPSAIPKDRNRGAGPAQHRFPSRGAKELITRLYTRPSLIPSESVHETVPVTQLER
jgi:hypothetical protein